MNYDVTIRALTVEAERAHKLIGEWLVSIDSNNPIVQRLVARHAEFLAAADALGKLTKSPADPDLPEPVADPLGYDHWKANR